MISVETVLELLPEKSVTPQQATEIGEYFTYCWIKFCYHVFVQSEWERSKQHLVGRTDDVDTNDYPILGNAFWLRLLYGLSHCDLKVSEYEAGSAHRSKGQGVG
jgi:hypothetical protein